jgi:hypothetical protein
MVNGLTCNIELAWMLQAELLKEAEEFHRHRPEGDLGRIRRLLGGWA